MRKKLLIHWGNTYAFLNLEYLIDHLSQMFEIDVLISTEHNSFQANEFCLKNRNINRYKIHDFRSIFPGSRLLNYYKLYKWVKNNNYYQFCISGDESQIYSKFLLQFLSPQTKKIIFWTHTSFLLQSKKVIKLYKENNLGNIYDCYKDSYHISKNKNNNIKIKSQNSGFFDRIYKYEKGMKYKSYVIRFLKSFLVRILKKISRYLILLEDNILKFILVNRIKLTRNIIDHLSQVGGGNYDKYLFNNSVDVEMFNKITKKNCAFLTSHPLTYKKTEFKNNQIENETIYMPLSIYPYSILSDNFIKAIKEAIILIKENCKVTKVVVRNHPSHDKTESRKFVKKLGLLLNDINFYLEEGSQPIQNEIQKYSICLSTLSAVIKDIRACNEHIKIILIKEISKDIAPEPELFFDEKDGVFWIRENLKIDNKVFKTNIFPNYTNIPIDEYLI